MRQAATGSILSSSITSIFRYSTSDVRATVITMRPFFAFRQKSLFIPGCVQVAIIYLVSLSGRLCVCVTCVVFTECESCTKPASTNPGYMEAGEYGLTRGTCFVARRLELLAVAGLRWLSWCVLGGEFFFVFCFFRFFLLRTHTACCKHEAALPHLPLY